ncbi:MAG TPA: L,D-transpeptidase, partial [Acidimicrobiia bacterium]|nr:L,D-transpeptidase [Acidimicrobiia bacterium]
ISAQGGKGYWVADVTGGVFAFGEAKFLGSIPGLRAAGHAVGPARIVAMAATPSGHGYWLADDQGGIFAFGDAPYLGSLPGLRNAGHAIGQANVVAMAATPSGDGYWLLDDQGGLFTFGDATFLGSLPGLRAAGHAIGWAPVVAMAPTATGDGYWLVDERGGVFTFGDARFSGSDAEAGWGTTAIASRPGGGYWLAKRLDFATFPAVPAGSGTGRRIVYSNSAQRVWLVETGESVVGSWPVSGRRGVPSPGHYRVFSKSRVSSSGNLRLDYMTRFAHGQTLAIGFHGIPIDPSGRPIQSESELGEYRSAGCVRQRLSDAARLYEWAPVGTLVVVLP